MAGKAAREKGTRGEIEVAAILAERGFDASRNARNGISAEDIAHAIPGVWLEVKRTERPRILEYCKQAESQAEMQPWLIRGAGAVRLVQPVVVWRPNRERWRVVIDLDYFLDLIGGTNWT